MGKLYSDCCKKRVRGMSAWEFSEAVRRTPGPLTCIAGVRFGGTPRRGKKGGFCLFEDEGSCLGSAELQFNR